MPEFPQGDGPLDLSVLLATYNEQDAIGSVILEVRSALAEWRGGWELLVVDDGSSDRTVERAHREGVRVVRCVKHGGYGSTIKAGIRAARGAVIATLDADGSYDPTHLPQLLSFLPEFDQVNGARSSEQGTCKILRVPAKWAIRKLTEIISGKRIPDLNTGMKVFKRSLMLPYLWVLPQGFSCSTSMTLAFLCNDHAVKYVPISYRKRIGGSTFRPIWDSAKYLLTAMRVIMYFRPLRLIVPIASLTLLMSLTAALYNVYHSPSGLRTAEIVVALSGVVVLAVGVKLDSIIARRRNLAKLMTCNGFVSSRPDSSCEHEEA